jgi:hypothetical protein
LIGNGWNCCLLSMPRPLKDRPANLNLIFHSAWHFFQFILQRLSESVDFPFDLAENMLQDFHGTLGQELVEFVEVEDNGVKMAVFDVPVDAGEEIENVVEAMDGGDAVAVEVDGLATLKDGLVGVVGEIPSGRNLPDQTVHILQENSAVLAKTHFQVVQCVNALEVRPQVAFQIGNWTCRTNLPKNSTSSPRKGHHTVRLVSVLSLHVFQPMP